MRIARTLLALGLMWTLIQPAQGAQSPFDEGMQAYRAGDFAGALEIWRPLAEEGMTEAQYNLGLLYYGGKGVEPDATEAHSWYLRAATGGFARAQYKVAEMYEAGDGVRRALPRAHFWFSMAKRQKYEDAGKRRKRLAKRMTSSEIAMAELRMRQQKRRESGHPDEVSLD